MVSGAAAFGRELWTHCILAVASISFQARDDALQQCRARIIRRKAFAPEYPREDLMATYVTLLNYTDQGIRNTKEAPQRIEAAKALIESMGGRFVAYYLTLGQFDTVIIAEAPDDETVAKVVMKIAGAGNVRTTTMRAFDEAEATRIFQSLD